MQKLIEFTDRHHTWVNKMMGDNNKWYGFLALGGWLKQHDKEFAEIVEGRQDGYISAPVFGASARIAIHVDRQINGEPLLTGTIPPPKMGRLMRDYDYIVLGVMPNKDSLALMGWATVSDLQHYYDGKACHYPYLSLNPMDNLREIIEDAK